MRRKSLVGLLVVTCVLSLSVWASPVQPDGAARDTSIVDTVRPAIVPSPLDWIRALFGTGKDDPTGPPPAPADGLLDGGDPTTQSLEPDPDEPPTEVGPATTPDG